MKYAFIGYWGNRCSDDIDAEKQVKAKDFTVSNELGVRWDDSIDYVSKQTGKDKCGELYYLVKSIELMSVSNAAFFMPGWERDTEAVLLHEIAEKYGIEIIYGEEKEEEWNGEYVWNEY